MVAAVGASGVDATISDYYNDDDVVEEEVEDDAVPVARPVPSASRQAPVAAATATAPAPVNDVDDDEDYYDDDVAQESPVKSSHKRGPGDATDDSVGYEDDFVDD